MLRYAVTFFVIALIAAVMGFGGIARASVGIAELLFCVFCVLLLITIAARLLTGRSPIAA